MTSSEIKIDKNIQTGFEQIFVNNDLKDFQILEVLKNASQNLPIKNKKDLEIFQKVIDDYEKILKGVKKDENIFFFNDYDKLEFSRLISDHNKLIRYVIYRYKYKTYPEKKIIEDYPPCVQIEPASICNYRCIMCYQSDKTFSEKKNNYMGFMKFDIFKRLVDELEGNVEAITFASRGEPTLHKQFPDFLKYCKDKFVAIKINTNLSTMTEKLATSIFENDVQTIVISSDAAEKENYEKIRVKGVFEKVMKNLEILFNTKMKFPNSRTIIRVSGVKINDKQDLNKMKDVYGKFTDSVAFVNYLPWESSYENKKNNIESPCTDLWKRLFVWYDGKINPCDYDYKSFLNKYNFADKSLKDAWNSEHYNQLRKKHLNKKRSDIFPCDRCNNV